MGREFHMGLCGNKGARHGKLGWGLCFGYVSGYDSEVFITNCSWCGCLFRQEVCFEVCFGGYVSPNRTFDLLIHLGPHKSHTLIRAFPTLNPKLTRLITNYPGHGLGPGGKKFQDLARGLGLEVDAR